MVLVARPSRGEIQPADRIEGARRAAAWSAVARRQLPPTVVFGTIALYLVLPMLAVVLYSLATRWTAHILPDGYTLDHWITAITDARVQAAFARSISLATAVVAIDVAVVLPATYWARVRNPRIRTLVEVAAVVPFALPYVVIAFGILRLTGEIAPFAQNTGWLLALAHAAVAFPFLYWALDGAMAAANVEQLSEAAETCGARPWQIIWRVVVPNVKSGLLTGGILVFATSFNEFALAQILAGAAFETVPLWTNEALGKTIGKFNELAVVTAVTFALLFGLSAAVVYWNRAQTLRLLPGARAMEQRQL
jgi:putative spermidine/putrescine transport system permease protein